MVMNLSPYMPLLETFARSGGGGSSSDGGGVGGLFAVGYIVMYYLAKPFKRFLNREVALAVTASLALVLSIGAVVLAITGSSGVLWWFVIEFVSGVWIGWSAQMFGFWEKMKKRFKKADEDIKKAGWDETALQTEAANIFTRYQNDWSRRDGGDFAQYMTPRYAVHSLLMLKALAELRRFNRMQNLKIVRMDTSAVYDNTDDSQDFFSVFIEAQAEDALVTEDERVLFTDKKPFIEEWIFQRGNEGWLLAGIRQTTEAPSARELDLEQFAQTNNMFYSLDMGWLFLPARGELFNRGKWQFGYSDVNNHVIGLYNQRLVQLYTYVRSLNGKQDSSKTYLVGQIHVPKSYGGILIERKKGLFKRVFAPKGYEKYEFEWPDFNKRYSVYATDQSRLATFELLNPGFMAYLHDTFNDVNIEVIDNVIFFYTEKAGVRTDYESLMQLLMKAFKELQL